MQEKPGVDKVNTDGMLGLTLHFHFVQCTPPSAKLSLKIK